MAKTLTGTRIRFWPDRQIFVADAQWSLRAASPSAPGRPPTWCPAWPSGSATTGPGAGPGPHGRRRRRRGPLGPQEATFRFDGGISEFCEHLSSGTPVSEVIRLAGAGQFTETVPVLDDQGHLTPTEVERELDVDVALRWGSGYDTVTRSFVNVIATPKGGTH